MSQSAPAPFQVTVDRASVTVLPGQQDRVVITVLNSSGMTWSLDLAVQGLPGNWLTLTPYSLSLSAGQKALAMLQLLPPLEAPTGSYPLTVWARVRDDPSVGARANLMLVIGEELEQPEEMPPIEPEPVAYAGAREAPPPIVEEPGPPMGGPVELTLMPSQQTTARSAQFTVRVSNQGRMPLDVTLHPHEASGACSLDISPARLRLSPGGEGRAQLTMRPTSALVAGEVRRAYPFTVEARS
ncbi:MAG: hypothetical protein JXA74_03490, partial [Anaerolineae bacterium]|nr:hypothetical protein [Anaerolineae bacterium]